MGLLRLLRRKIKIIFGLSLLIAAIFYRDKLQSLYNTYSSSGEIRKQDVTVLSEKQLAEYNGIVQNRLYLSLMGTVFDVTKGLVHYGEGGSYHYFVGKDASRAFVTGNFKDESDTKDHVLDLTCDELFSLVDWKKTFRQKYKKIGVLAGRFYDSSGKVTAYSKQLAGKLKECRVKKEEAKQGELEYPPCNVEWTAGKGSRVWCTKSSGGVTRSWVGVPRQRYAPGEDKSHCVCVNLYKDHTQALLKEYINCNSDSPSCDLE